MTRTAIARTAARPVAHTQPVGRPADYFVIVTEHFGNPLWASTDPDLIYTDDPREIAHFECTLNDAPRMAQIMARECGYPWRIVNAGSAEYHDLIAAHYTYKAKQAAITAAFVRSQEAKACAS